MQIIAVGMNHNTAPVELREQVAISPPELPVALARLRAVPGLDEGFVISTCNRTEVYGVGEDALITLQPGDLIRYLSDLKAVPAARLEPHMYAYTDLAAAEHLFRVAAGLDAMVLGETQVLGQVREAQQAAAACGAAGKVTHHLLRAALVAGKRAQTETGIGQNAVSVSYAAVELVKKLFEGLRNLTVLAIGAGETAKLTVRHLLASGAGRILVANRTWARAQRLAGEVNGQSVRWDDIIRLLPEVDVVISSTGAPGHVLSRAAMQEALRHRRGRPIFLFDIAVPRDIDPTVGRLEGAYLYDIDDLQQVVSANLRERNREARRAERIVDEELARFQTWVASQAVVPTIRLLRDKVEAMRHLELQRALAKLPDLSDRERSVVEAMTVALVNKILNDPTQRLKGLAAGDDATAAAETLSLLFNLTDAEPEPPGLDAPVAAPVAPGVDYGVTSVPHGTAGPERSSDALRAALAPARRDGL